jgi:hypothetical protein
MRIGELYSPIFEKSTFFLLRNNLPLEKILKGHFQSYNFFRVFFLKIEEIEFDFRIQHKKLRIFKFQAQGNCAKK